MRGVLAVARRELLAYLRAPSGYVIAAVVLLVDGLLFNSFALGAGKRYSADVVRDFFYLASGTTMVAAVLLSMRLFAEELQTGTAVLLRTAPLTEPQVVAGKFAASWVFLAAITLLSLPMPLLVKVHGMVSAGHLAAGYLGLLLLGAACLAAGAFASALASSQVVAAILGAAVVVGLLIAWLLARVTSPPLSVVIEHLALFNKHFVPFMQGMVRTRDIVYYVSITWAFLLLATQVLRSRRWS